MSFAGISPLRKDMLSHVIEHALHHLGFVDLKGRPLPPLLEARRCCVSVVALHIVAKLLMGLLLESFLELFNMLTQLFSLTFMLTNLFILLAYFCMCNILQLFVLMHHFDMCIFFPQF
jgi:hypothetical protein